MNNNTSENETRLKEYVEAHNIKTEHLVYNESLHTVADAIRVSGIGIELIAKSIVMVGQHGETIVAFVPGKSRVSTKRVGRLLNQEPPKIASVEEALNLTSYPIGGTPFIGYPATRLVDKKILEVEAVYSGGGSDRSLLKLWTSEISKFDVIVGRIRK
ncbi:MAG: aminoacyl-tRNA deacylase [Candidatus Hodarchaeales archaeon]